MQASQELGSPGTQAGCHLIAITVVTRDVIVCRVVENECVYVAQRLRQKTVELFPTRQHNYRVLRHWHNPLDALVAQEWRDDSVPYPGEQFPKWD